MGMVVSVYRRPWMFIDIIRIPLMLPGQYLGHDHHGYKTEQQNDNRYPQRNRHCRMHTCRRSCQSTLGCIDRCFGGSCLFYKRRKKFCKPTLQFNKSTLNLSLNQSPKPPHYRSFQLLRSNRYLPEEPAHVTCHPIYSCIFGSKESHCSSLKRQVSYLKSRHGCDCLCGSRSGNNRHCSHCCYIRSYSEGTQYRGKLR
ncbi:hypothetical protein Barb4_03947 [Bacteroidales bacterium Barb4]|nr:hypothetical protein Barb4_03947 [Bacteroidales bacterium Barb4]